MKSRMLGGDGGLEVGPCLDIVVHDVFIAQLLKQIVAVSATGFFPTARDVLGKVAQEIDSQEDSQCSQNHETMC